MVTEATPFGAVTVTRTRDVVGSPHAWSFVAAIRRCSRRGWEIDGGSPSRAVPSATAWVMLDETGGGGDEDGGAEGRDWAVVWGGGAGGVGLCGAGPTAVSPIGGSDLT